MPLRSVARRRARAASALAVAFALPCLLLALDAAARAGGGEHYEAPSRSGSSSSGSSRSGSSSSSSDSSWRSSDSSGSSSGELSWETVGLILIVISLPFSLILVVPVGLVLLSWTAPVVGVPASVGVGGLAYWFFLVRPGSERASSLKRRDSGRTRPRPGLEKAVAELRRRDPAFSVPAFLGRTRKVFLDVQEAWFLRRIEDVRHQMSDGLHRRFTTLLALMRAEGRRDAMTDAQVIASDLVDAGTSGAFEFVTVRLDAALRDTETGAEIGDEAARRLAASTALESFTELWTFVRRPGAVTRSGFDLGLGACPGCGAPFEGGAAGTCRYCKAIVNSGSYDWVLAEITQESEYVAHARKAPGLEELRARDADAGAELLEDRALLVFWKWLEARALDRPAVLRKLASEAGWSRMEADFTAGRSQAIRLPAVGGADLAAIEVDVDGVDRAHVDVRWSAAVKGGKPAPRPHRHVVTLVRATGATTDRGVGLASERCGSCQAPLTEADAPTCDYCGHVFGAAAREWQLERVTPYEAWQRPQAPKQRAEQARTDEALAAFGTTSERLRLLQLMAAVARSDGFVDRKEIKLLRGTAQRWQVPWSEVQPVLDGAAGDLLDGVPDPEALLRTLVSVARSDGRVDPRELALIRQVAAHLKQEPGTVERLLAA